MKTVYFSMKPLFIKWKKKFRSSELCSAPSIEIDTNVLLIHKIYTTVSRTEKDAIPVLTHSVWEHASVKLVMGKSTFGLNCWWIYLDISIGNFAYTAAMTVGCTFNVYTGLIFCAISPAPLKEFICGPLIHIQTCNTDKVLGQNKNTCFYF